MADVVCHLLERLQIMDMHVMLLERFPRGQMKITGDLVHQQIPIDLHPQRHKIRFNILDNEQNE